MKPTALILAILAPLVLNAQSAQNVRLNNLLEKRAAAQRTLNKAEAEKRSADSLLQRSRQLDTESRYEKEGVRNEKSNLEKRIAEAEKKGSKKKAEIYNAYAYDLKTLQEREAVAKAKMEQSKQCEEHGRERLKPAKKAVKEAQATLDDINKQIEKLREAESEREARKR